jgi:NitT/TauT family transport system ATP-binding protein
MLAPLPIASTIGVGHWMVPMVAPMSMGQGGHAFTVSTGLWRALATAGAPENGDPILIGKALRHVITARERTGQPPLTFGVVFPFACHNYDLRYWLAASGIHPDRDVRLVVVPPPFTVDSLTAGHVDGFCVGEPWNSLAVATGVGRIATTKAALWRGGPDKVLGMRTEWAESHPDQLNRLLRALHYAGIWCDDSGNHAELAHLMAGPRFLDCPPEIARRGLAGSLLLGEAHAHAIPDFIMFAQRAANFPWTSHALWMFSQMVRWGQVEFTPQTLAAAKATFRPDLYRAALAGIDVAMPKANAKVEGALAAPTPVASSNGKLLLGPDGFFDGLRFDPDDIERYIAGFAIHADKVVGV